VFDRHGEGSGSGVRWMLDVKKVKSGSESGKR
jgi:hypothetical protein